MISCLNLAQCDFDTACVAKDEFSCVKDGRLTGDFVTDQATTEVTCKEACTNSVAFEAYEWETGTTTCNFAPGVTSEIMERKRHCIQRKRHQYTNTLAKATNFGLRETPVE